MLNNLEILKSARDLGSTTTLEQVNTALAGYDYPALREAEKGHYRVELWDKVSPINGVPAEKVLLDADTADAIYLIYVNDRLVYLQKFDPEQMGFVPMTPEVAMQRANALVDTLIENVIDARVENEVLVQLL